MTGLSIENLSMRFDLPNGGSVQALKDVTLNLKEGELLSVLGPSGCGKTTLLNIVAGFLAPTEGRIVLNGHTVHGPMLNAAWCSSKVRCLNGCQCVKMLALAPL